MAVSGDKTLNPGYPLWLNKEFFADIMKNEGAEIKRLSLEPANQKGENYSSIMLRANLRLLNIDQSEQGRSYIVKLDPVGKTQDIMNQFNVFPKEIEMYQSLLPYFEALYSNVGVDIKLSPRCLRTGNDPGNMIILEDLCEQGYRTVNRLEGMDMPHSEMALAALAKFHAASAVYYQEVRIKK